jgi:hypothetical protein
MPLERGVDPSACCTNALLHAKTEIVRMLLDLPSERGVDPPTDEHCALRLECGFSEIRKMLETPWFKSAYKMGLRSLIHLKRPTFGGIVEL